MDLNKIKHLIKDILNEGLNKNDYNKLIQGINLGVELEVINDSYSAQDYDFELEMDFGQDFKYLNGVIDDTNERIGTLNKVISNAATNKYISEADEITYPDESYQNTRDKILTGVNSELDRVLLLK